MWQVRKVAHRANGDYVFMGPGFCANGCGKFEPYHADTCPFKPRPRAPRAATVTLPPGIQRKASSYTVEVG